MNKYLKGKMYPRMGRNHLQKFREMKGGMWQNKKMISNEMLLYRHFKGERMVVFWGY